MIDWDALYKISLGLYVLGAKDGERDVGSIVDAVMIGANKPCALVLSCNNGSYTKQCIEKTNEFSLSVLPKDIEPSVIAVFGFQSSRDNNKWDLITKEYFMDLPVLSVAVSYIKAKVLHKYILESNTIFVAEIVGAIKNSDTLPLLYQDYRGELKDLVIKSFNQMKKEKTMSKKWVCTVCNYVYDGDVPFEKLDDDYICPICGVDKSFFEEREVE